jgi:hypothetical protein
MTGRAMGVCAGIAAPGIAIGGRGRGCGMGFGRGGGRGLGRGWSGPAVGAVAPTGKQEVAILKQQAQQIGKELEGIQSRIQELETKPDKS